MKEAHNSMSSSGLAAFTRKENIEINTPLGNHIADKVSKEQVASPKTAECRHKKLSCVFVAGAFGQAQGRAGRRQGAAPRAQAAI